MTVKRVAHEVGFEPTTLGRDQSLRLAPYQTWLLVRQLVSIN